MPEGPAQPGGRESAVGGVRSGPQDRDIPVRESPIRLHGLAPAAAQPAGGPGRPVREQESGSRGRTVARRGNPPPPLPSSPQPESENPGPDFPPPESRDPEARAGIPGPTFALKVSARVDESLC